MNYYKMFPYTGASDYVMPGPEVSSLFKGCAMSEFQFLDHSKLICSLSTESGLTFTDFILYAGCIPLISEIFKQVLEKAGVDNLFYKPVIFINEDLNIHEPYWLALPPRIECVDKNKSEIEIFEDPYSDPEDQIRKLKKIVIKKGSTGNYKIFKLSPAFSNQDIIVTEELKKILEKAKLENVYFLPV